MDHSFNASLSDPTLCNKCKRNEQAHSNQATCESCQRTGECVIIDDILMCELCQARDVEIKNELVELGRKRRQDITARHNNIEPRDNYAPIDSVIPIDNAPLARFNKSVSTVVDDNVKIAAVADTISKSIKIDTSITSSKEFYNAETIAIAELDNKISHDETIPEQERKFKLFELVQNRINHLKHALFEVKQTEIEIISREAAIKEYLQGNIVNKFRADERETLKAKYIDYKPIEKVPSAPRIKLSEEDKVIMNYAKLLFAPKDSKGKVVWDTLSDNERSNLMSKARVFYNASMAGLTTGENKDA